MVAFFLSGELHGQLGVVGILLSSAFVSEYFNLIQPIGHGSQI